MRVFVVLHRWWGVAFCLLFAAWFASGIVMHFVPFPARSEADRFAGLVAIDRDQVARGPAEAVAVSGIRDALRVRLVGRSDGPIYLISGASAAIALRAFDLGNARLASDQAALDIAAVYARSRGLDASGASVTRLISYDQWTVAGEFDGDRPLYRIALNDDAGSELYLSSMSGDVVLVTTRTARVLGYFGSVVHWLYPTALRHHQRIWSAMMWWLSLLGTVGAGFGIAIGLVRLITTNRRGGPAYRGLQSWHYRLGLVFAPFILGWIFSGFSSMDDGRLFSANAPPAVALTLAGASPWDHLPAAEMLRVASASREIEWFAFAGQIYRRDRAAPEEQQLSLVVPETDAISGPRAFLAEDEIDSAANLFGRNCGHAFAVGASDAYRAKPALPDAPVFRIACGDTWHEIDGASGALLSRLDRSRRAYRWLFSGLHTLDFPPLQSRPLLRTIIIVTFCLCGLAFSLTGAVLAGRRLRASAGDLFEENDAARGRAP